MPVELQVAYNDAQIFFRYRWPARQPHVLTDLLRYSDGKWQRQLSTPDRLGPGRHLRGSPGHDGRRRQRAGVPALRWLHHGRRQHAGLHRLRARRRAPAQVPAGHATRSQRLVLDRRPGTLDAQRRAGYFLDLWHWRAHLSNPLGRSDDQHVAWYRLYDSGEPLFFSNWDADSGQPRWMFDPSTRRRARVALGGRRGRAR